MSRLVHGKKPEVAGKNEEIAPEARVAYLVEGVRRYHVASAADEGLARLGPPAIPSLVSLLGDEDWQVRGVVRSALEKIGQPAVDPLIALLETESASSGARAGAAAVLGAIGDPRAIEPLARTLDGVPVPAALALARFGDRRAVESLAACMGTGPADERDTAAVVLASFGDARATDRLLAMLESDDDNTRDAAAAALAKIDDPRAHAAVEEHEAHRFDLIAGGFTEGAEWLKRARQSYERNVESGSPYDPFCVAYHIDRLRDLGLRVEMLPVEYPRQATVLGPGANAGLTVLQTITSNCNDAALALKTGIGADGKPITYHGVGKALRALVADMNAAGSVGLVMTTLDGDGVRLLSVLLEDIEGVARHLD